MLFVFTIAGLISGIVIASTYSFSIFAILFPLVPAGLIFFYSLIAKHKKLLSVSVFLFAVVFGAARMYMVDKAPTVLDVYVGQKITIQGRVVAEEDARANSNRITVSVTKVFDKPVTEIKLLAITDRFSSVLYGDVVTISGKLSKPKNFETDTGRVFNYVGYLAKDDVYYLLSFAEVQERIAGGFSLRGLLFSVKNWFLQGVQRLLGEPGAALAGGITVGAKQSLGKSLLEDFRIVGLIHIVVLSGYNVTIIAEAILRFLKFLPKRTALGFGVLSITLFALLTGAGATIVRASIMAILALIARATGRNYMLTRALFVAGALMLIINPRLLLFDPSFQLSFIATLGLIYIAPYIEQHISFVTMRFGMREIVGATIGTQIAVFPLLMYMTGVISLIALPANLLVLPIIPFAMLAVFITGLFGALLPTIGVPIAFVAHGMLGYIIGLTELFAKVPFATIGLSFFPLWLMFLIYAGIIFFLWKRKVILNEE